jgi:hypothetical protein
MGWFLGFSHIESGQFHRAPLYKGDVLYSREVCWTCSYSLSVLLFLRPSCNGLMDSGVSELTSVIWRPVRVPVNQISEKCARTTAHFFLRRFHHFICVGSTVNRFSDLSFISHNDDLVVRSVVRLSCLGSSTWVNLDLCSNSVIDINYNYIVLCVLWLIKLFLWSVNFVTVVTVSLCLSLCNPYIHTT